MSLTAPAVENRANRALVRFLAGLVGLPGNRVQIVSGHRKRLKTVALEGLQPAQIHQRLEPYI